MGLRRLLKNERGAVALYVALMSGVMLGSGALALHLASLMTLNTELQNAADAAALAAAAELDGTPTAIDRATAAATTAVFGSNQQSFATDGLGAIVTVGLENLTFLSALPADPGNSLDDAPYAPFITDEPADARFVRVRLAPRTMATPLINILAGPANAATAAAAVAGHDQVVCNFPPFMMCNPYEADEAGGIGAAFDPIPGQLVKLKARGPDAAWTPGAFSLLDSATGAQSTPELARQIATSDPVACYTSRVDVKTGQVTAIHGGINVRFGIYGNPFFGGNANRQWEFRPAVNVTKGRLKSGNDCSAPADDSVARPLGLDQCFLNGTCQRFGDGNWNRQHYWDLNHGGALPAELANASRFEVYQYEIANNLIPNRAAAGGENGDSRVAPRCWAGTQPTLEPDRRVLYVAIINCRELGPIHGNSAGALAVEAFAKVFLVRPMLNYEDDPEHSQDNLWIEMIGTIRPGADDGVLHDIVQLYR